MAATDLSVLLGVSRSLNANIAALSEALAGGLPGPDLIARAREESSAGLGSLRAIAPRPGGDDPVSANLPKVVDHLDLFLASIGAMSSAPALARKLLVHLLEEQMEITGALSGEPQRGSTGAPPAPDSKQELPGGRRPFTVGSLIGR